MSGIERFMAKVAIGPECWNWLGAMRGSRQQRGCFWDGQRNVDAARWMYQHEHPAEQISDRVVRHRCDNPLCVNPAHLELGSQADNVNDMWSRGRANLEAVRRGAAKGRAALAHDPSRRARGDRHGIHKRDVAGTLNPNAKLDDAAVATIVRLSRQGHSQRMIAERTGASQKTVWSILAGKSYCAACLRALAQGEK